MPGSRLTYVAFGLMLLFLPVVACAQVAGGSQLDVPVLETGQMPTAVPGDDRKPTSNVFEISLGAGTSFDDNVLPNLGMKRSDMYYTFTPSVAFTQTQRRVAWGLSYGPGLDVSQHHLFGDQFTNQFAGDFSWLISNRSTLSAEQSYIRSTNLFQRFGSQPFTTTPGPLDAPNQSIYVPNLRQTSLLSQMQYSYRLSAHTTFGLGGSFDLQTYDNVLSSSTTTENLLDSQTVSGRAYLAHYLSPRNQVGFQYGAQILKFRRVNSKTTVHTFLLFDDWKVTPNSRLTVYGGPQYSLLSNQALLDFGFITIELPLMENDWNWAAGASYSLTRGRVATVVDYSRQVASGSDFFGAVELDAGSVGLSCKISKDWTVNLDGAAANNQLLGVKNGENERTYSASLSLSRQILKNVSMNLSFERLNQTGQIAGFPPGNHDIAQISFQYEFLKPIGR